MVGSALLVLLTLGVTPSAEGRPAAAEDPMRGDVRLADVCFVDSLHGWTVGDRGTIRHTDDGGLHWDLQESGVECPLTSVSFLNDQDGWAAGGFAHPFTHTSSGVILWTHDGGQHWQHDPKLLLPAVRQIHFTTERQGWLVGCSSVMSPTGALVTRDAGRTWLPPCGDAGADWLAGDFLDARTAVFVGRSGAAAVLHQGELSTARTAGFGLRSLNRVCLAPQCGWLVGDGGLAVTTFDRGRSWQPPMGELPHEAAWFDFSAMAVRGPRCWIAGTPGSRVFFTPDAGRTWSVFPTGITIPIRALTFIDDDHGWAVGDLGTILVTNDGGRTWRRQRAGGTRVALLAILGQPEDIPLELIARYCGDEGHLGMVEVIGRRDVEVVARAEAPAVDRAHQAVLAVGGSGAETAWQFPLRQPGLGLPARQIVEGWNQANGGRGAESLHAYLVRQIRLWKPDAIVTTDMALSGDPLNTQIHRAVLEAVVTAADPAAFAEQIERVGLEPCQVKRVYAISPPGVRAAAELSTSQLAIRLGRTLADAATPARGLLEDRFTPEPAVIGLRLVSQSAGGSRTESGPRTPVVSEEGASFGGIILASGGDAHRPAGDGMIGNVELLRRLAQRRHHSEAILARFEQDPQAAPRLLAQMDDLTHGLDRHAAAWVVYRLADRYAHMGRWDMAIEAFQALVERYPDDPLCRPALLWMLQCYAAGERFGQEADRAANSRMEQAVALGHEIERTHPDLFAEPGVRYPLAAAYRQLGRPKEAERLYTLDRRGASRDAWWMCAQGEAWLAQPRGDSPKPVLTCVTCAVRPRLDGRLDDAVWQQAKPAALTSLQHDDAQWPGVVMLAHDAEFLYIGISCRQATDARYEKSSGTRTRDSDLSAHDRVDIFLDLDRDYATYYHLTIDHRGWAAESCFGDSTWNPAWFVSARTVDGAWNVEAAIPMRELTGKTAPDHQTTWAVGLQRTVPGVGFQSWSSPASTSVTPEGFGFLKFE